MRRQADPPALVVSDVTQRRVDKSDETVEIKKEKKKKRK